MERKWIQLGVIGGLCAMLAVTPVWAITEIAMMEYWEEGYYSVLTNPAAYLESSLWESGDSLTFVLPDVDLDGTPEMVILCDYGKDQPEKIVAMFGLDNEARMVRFEPEDSFWIQAEIEQENDWYSQGSQKRDAMTTVPVSDNPCVDSSDINSLYWEFYGMDMVSADADPGAYKVISGIFKIQGDALERQAQLEENGFETCFRQFGDQTAVQCGAFQVEENAKTRKAEVENAGFEAFILS